jgi:hypothetical protein
MSMDFRAAFSISFWSTPGRAFSTFSASAFTSDYFLGSSCFGSSFLISSFFSSCLLSLVGFSTLGCYLATSFFSVLANFTGGFASFPFFAESSILV